MDAEIKKALLRNLLLKTKIVLVFFSGILAIQLIGAIILFNGSVELDVPLGILLIVPIFIGIIIMDEFFVLRFIRMALDGKKKFAPHWSYVLGILEILYPTILMYYGGIMFGEYDAGITPFMFLNSPPLLVYVVLIVLSVFHFDFKLSALMGFLAMLGYGVVTLIAIDDGTELVVNLSKAPILFVSGIAAGFVGKRLLSSVRDSLESKNILINELDSRVKERTAEVESQKEQLEVQKDSLEEKNKEILDSINYAKRIQEAYLPHPDLLQFLIPTSFLLFKPKDLVSGDFYWYYTPDPDDENGDVFVVAADCTGHGVPGAIMSVVCCNAINKVVVNNKKRDTANILDEVREEIIQILTTKGDNQRKDGMDIAFARMNKKTGAIQFSGAHNPIWIIRGGAEEVEEVKADKQPIGNFERMEPFTAHELQLEKGDSFYLFSDGYADQFGGEKGKKFKTANFKKLLLSLQDKSMDQQKRLLDEAFENWRGNYEQLDDVCVIGVRF